MGLAGMNVRALWTMRVSLECLDAQLIIIIRQLCRDLLLLLLIKLLSLTTIQLLRSYLHGCTAHYYNKMTLQRFIVTFAHRAT